MAVVNQQLCYEK